MKHNLPIEFLKEKNEIHVIGAGGNGAQFINGLARMVLSLRALGHPGFVVKLHDGDLVTEANIGRQLYSGSDIGLAKSTVLVNRINAYYGLNFDAVPTRWPNSNSNPDSNRVAIVVGCVDNNAARRQIGEHLKKGVYRYWLDMGNSAKSGQVIFGESTTHYVRRLQYQKRQRARKADDDDGYYDGDTTGEGPRLPTVLELFKDMRNPKIPEDLTPSCSLAGALERQDLFINQLLSTWALQLLWGFYRAGSLENHGYFINSERGLSTPLPVDPVGWERMGFYWNTRAPLRKIKKVLVAIRPFHPGRFRLECGHVMEGHGHHKIRCTLCQHEGKN
jgi:PRTRC genetic system ThiF family protein